MDQKARDILAKTIIGDVFLKNMSDPAAGRVRSIGLDVLLSWSAQIPRKKDLWLLKVSGAGFGWRLLAEVPDR